jgi:guanine nucleotide-binding protein alpha-1 subunit
MYNPTSLEEERLSWRPVVYYNIARPVRRIFEVIDAYGELEDDDGTMVVDISNENRNNSRSNSAEGASEATLVGSQNSSSAEKHLATLRYRLGPLLAAESSLAERIAGGQPTPTKGNLFVRSGWQARSLLKGRDRPSLIGQRSSFENATFRRSEDSGTTLQSDKFIEDVAHILSVCKDDIKDLWEHPVIQRLRDRRRLRLEEWAE